ncbi:MAG: radical SAM protein [Candidatus Pacebacteria bacterium]|nr:radical SAM protein [Candidatus Paceibacterota bacterium]
MENQSILLVNPRYTERVYRVKKSPSGLRPPLGLAYLASSLEKEGFKIEILDANAEFLTPEETAERIINSSHKYIGFTVVTITMPIVNQISRLVKNARPEKFIMVGGPHATFMAEDTLKECPAIDLVVKGEGEITASELLKALQKNEDVSQIKGITFRKGNEIMSNPDRELIENIDELPFPARHLLPRHLYSQDYLTDLGFKNIQSDSVITARGCPNRCVFCSSAAYWKRVRARSPENVVAELEWLKKEYNIKYINFLDDTIILNGERMAKICSLMLEKKININWSCYARVTYITPELVALMKKAGCRFINFGVESGNQDILKRIQKNITLDEVRRAIKTVKKAGLKVMCDFMVGLPGDTRETVQQTIDFAKELSPNFAFFSITTPFPGTGLYEDLRREGLVEGGYIWQNMSLHERTNFHTPTLSNQDLQNLYARAHRQFYYRPAFIFQTIKWVLLHPYELRNFYFLTQLQISREMRNISDAFSKLKEIIFK